MGAGRPLRRTGEDGGVTRTRGTMGDWVRVWESGVLSESTSRPSRHANIGEGDSEVQDQTLHNTPNILHSTPTPGSDRPLLHPYPAGLDLHLRLESAVCLQRTTALVVPSSVGIHL